MRIGVVYASRATTNDPQDQPFRKRFDRLHGTPPVPGLAGLAPTANRRPNPFGIAGAACPAPAPSGAPVSHGIVVGVADDKLSGAIGLEVGTDHATAIEASTTAPTSPDSPRPAMVSNEASECDISTETVRWTPNVRAVGQFSGEQRTASPTRFPWQLDADRTMTPRFRPFSPVPCRMSPEVLRESEMPQACASLEGRFDCEIVERTDSLLARSSVPLAVVTHAEYPLPCRLVANDVPPGAASTLKFGVLPPRQHQPCRIS